MYDAEGTANVFGQFSIQWFEERVEGLGCGWVNMWMSRSPHSALIPRTKDLPCANARLSISSRLHANMLPRRFSSLPFLMPFHVNAYNWFLYANAYRINIFGTIPF